MARTKYDIQDLIRRKTAMGAEIVSKIDPEYAWYAGAAFETAMEMAMIDTSLKHGLIPEKYLPFVKLYRAYLNQQRKAFFASVGSDVFTKLAFIQGDTRVIKRATAPATDNE